MFERALSSGLRFDEPPFKVKASNITPDQDTGIGKWSAADIKKALQKGERPDGVLLAAIMPYGFYEIFTPGDLDAIVAYLRSVKPVKQSADADLQGRAASPGSAGRREAVAEADMTDKVKRGFYLVDHRALHGMPHADGAAVREFATPRQGRIRVQGPVGRVDSRNITSHKEKGIGDWSDAEIKRAITEGVRKDGTRSSRRWASSSTEHDRRRSDAIVAYLRTVPPKE